MNNSVFEVNNPLLWNKNTSPKSIHPFFDKWHTVWWLWEDIHALTLFLVSKSISICEVNHRKLFYDSTTTRKILAKSLGTFMIIRPMFKLLLLVEVRLHRTLLWRHMPVIANVSRLRLSFLQPRVSLNSVFLICQNYYPLTKTFIEVKPKLLSEVLLESWFTESLLC